MSTWSTEVKADAIDGLGRAHDALADVVECADEYGDHEIDILVGKIQDQIADLTTLIELRR